MNIDEIKELVRLMVEHELAEVDVSEGETKYRLKRAGAEVMMVPAAVPVAAAAPAPAPAASAAPAAAPAAPAEKFLEIKSPMVGTFYAAPSPDSDPFVTVGARINDESVACIVEAMKVMNEIKAECAGVVTEVCVKNAQPVEWGQVLFRVRPN